MSILFIFVGVNIRFLCERMELKYWDLLEDPSLYFLRCSLPMMRRRADSISHLACARYWQQFGDVNFFSVIVVMQRLINGLSHSDNMELLSTVRASKVEVHAEGLLI